MEHQIKLPEKYMPVMHCVSSFKGTSSKKLQDTANASFFCFTSAFTSRYFLELLRLHSTLKKIFLFNRFTDPPHPTPSLYPLNGQNLLSMRKVVCLCSLKYICKNN